jgi:hypothetical protein
MNYVYYINGEKFTTEHKIIPWDDISSPNENTPAYEDLNTGHNIWCLKTYKLHRLNGPAVNWRNHDVWFWLNGKYYKDIHAWLKEHPNQDNTFQIEMLLKYT